MKLNYLKKISLATAQQMRRLQSERIHAFKQFSCATFLHYVVEAESWQMFLNRANFCKQRSCYVCQWRSSVKLRLKLFPALQRLTADYPDKHFIFLTLTVRNCHQSDLRRTLALMQSGWNRLVRRTDFPAIGYLNSVELTRPRDCFYGGVYLGRFGSKSIKNWQDLLKQQGAWNPQLWAEYLTEEVHPHFHALMMVDESYFENTHYIDTPGWSTRWRLAMKLNYSPIVDIRRVYSSGREDGINKAVFEATKYALKPSDITDAFAPFIFRQLHGLRLVRLAGLLADYANQSDIDQIMETGESGEEVRHFGVPLHYFWSEDERYDLGRLGHIYFEESC